LQIDQPDHKPYDAIYKIGFFSVFSVR